jgi:two-component system response regulator YesN
MYNILLVDDEPIIRKGLAKIIRKHGSDIGDIRTAENGAEALKLLETYRPHFLFTDIRMPKMDGLELCRIVAETHPHIQSVIITGYDDFEYARRSILYGVKDYVLKPVTKRNLEDVLRRLIESAQKRGQAVVSLSRFNEWVDKLSDAVWTLNTAAVTAQVESMFEELNGLRLDPGQLTRHISDVVEMLRARLGDSDLFPKERLDAEDAPIRSEQLQERLLHVLMDGVERLRVKRKGKLKDPVEEAKQYIEDHLSRDFSLEEVADYIGLNASYFSQLFKQSTGETFAQYRIRRRIERAKQLLAVPHRKITDVSFEVGYADHPHFTKTFKKATGCTPSEYREMLGIDK